eukprot:CAMPEP_0118891976 /NCGR_PEP_ID=MMETSP1166-20130328/1761_1 /TAXON_ID=1104430 /ORGANISM="Chrysoreinhardia sp, Strain CCMP3193" /LENGTH=342 /DNA_ID=CAMNT_0006830661 /DNA_START=1 /DNA_END=1029 /DNA_ORIENTATION=-
MKVEFRAPQKKKKKQYGLVKPQGVFSREEEAPQVDAASAMRLSLEGARRRAEANAREQASKALREDSSAFDYDGVYESMAKERRVGAAPSARTARYIPKLQEAAKIRDVDFDRVYERQLLKEEEQNKHLPQERYVTAAYKKQLLESRKWDAEDNANAMEDKTSAESAGMQSFYANLLTKNIAVGADVDKSAVSAYTHGSHRFKRMVGHSAKTGAKEDDDGAVGGDEEQHSAKTGAKEDDSGDSAKAAKEEDFSARGATTTKAAKKEDGAPPQGDRPPPVAVKKEEPPPVVTVKVEEPPTTQPPATTVTLTEQPAPAATASDVDAARARFLARKKARTQPPHM